MVSWGMQDVIIDYFLLHILPDIHYGAGEMNMFLQATSYVLLRRRYGLLGANGCGKSCLLKALSCRELPIPEHVDIFHLGQPNLPSNFTEFHAQKPEPIF